LEPDQAWALRLLALPEGPDLSLAAAAAVLDLDESYCEGLLESLVDLSLLKSTAPGRWRYHDLLRLYARHRSGLDSTASEREAALSRLLDFYLATARQAYAVENPGDRMLEHLPTISRSGLFFEDHRLALRWLFGEGPCVLATVQQAADAPTLLPRAEAVLFVVQDLMESGAYLRQYTSAAQAVADSAHATGDTCSEGRARVLLAWVHYHVGHLQEAHAEAKRALTLGQAAKDSLTCSYALNLRGTVALVQGQGHYEDAIKYHTQALSLFRADGNRYGETSALSNIARVHLELGHVGQALAAAQRAVESWQELGATLRLTNGYYTLGLALHTAGRHGEALSRFRQAQAGFQESRQMFWEGMATFRMAQVELAMLQPGQATAHAEHALVLLRDIGGNRWRAHVLVLLGQALEQLGQTERARTCWQQALTDFEQLESPETTKVRALLAACS
ncbi:tetratricopeptide repeat protein, partial [Streptomyces sp. NPDC005407]|uniref:tetratricopeptide repeat protein n=1 Tax=Streptomyces sp. NPDC005407 TaxID=3155340 RepID=UPI0033AC5127